MSISHRSSALRIGAPDPRDSAPVEPEASRRARQAPSGAVRVMHVVFGLQPGGMELGVAKLVNGLDPARVQSAICSTTPGGSVRDLINPDVPVFELHRRNGNDPRLIWKLYRLFRRERPHIVHTHAWGTLFEGMIAARLARVRAVVHGEHGTLQLKPHQRWLQRHGWSHTNQVLSVSTRLSERMERETGYPLSRIATIRNGVDLSRFGRVSRAEARAQLGLSGGALVTGAVGRLVSVKDHETLLEAIATLRRDGVKTTLLIVGDGPLKATLMTRASALGIDDDVRFLGHRQDVATVLAALDVFVLSSVSEGLSNTILEAMASRLPVVATRVGGADELVQHGVTGLLVPARSPAAMAAALADLFLDAASRSSMGAAGRILVESEFSLAQMVRRYEALYVDLASGGAGRGRVGWSARESGINNRKSPERCDIERAEA